MTIPSEDADYGDLGQAFPSWATPGRDLAAANARDPASPQILQRVGDRDADWEAVD